MVLLIDTNVLIDNITARGAFYEDAEKFLISAPEMKMRGISPSIRSPIFGTFSEKRTIQKGAGC